MLKKFPERGSLKRKQVKTTFQERMDCFTHTSHTQIYISKGESNIIFNNFYVLYIFYI